MTRWARLALLSVTVLALGACKPIYGASFDFPEEAPVPPGVTVLATDTGSDQDDPLRSRQQVVDLGSTTQAELLASFRDAYPATEGWTDGKVGGDRQLCLVNREDPEYTEVVEVYAYGGTRVPATPTRRLVIVTRMEDPDPRVCGSALGWTNVDLFQSKKDQEWGSVRGRLLLAGDGPYPSPLSSGTVRLVGPTTVGAEVDRKGRFELQAPPGRYRLVGTSPGFMRGTGTCSGTEDVTSEAGFELAVDVVCQVR